MKSTELVRYEPPKPDQLESLIKTVDFNMHVIAGMKEEQWREALGELTQNIDAAKTPHELRVFERNLKKFIDTKGNRQVEIKAVGATTTLHLLGAFISSAAALGTYFASLPQGATMFTAALTGFAASIARDIYSSAKTDQFRNSDIGKARMKELANVLRGVAGRIDEETARVISGTAH